MRVLGAPALVAALFVLSACGSAHRTRDYSVKQVVSAFKADGVALHMASGGCSEGFVCLENYDQGVQAYVFVGPKSGQIAFLAGGSDRPTDRANVTVVWERQYRKQVRTALRSLH